MESEVNIKCEASGCIGPASKHAVFGLRVFEAAGNIHISEMPYSAEHLDLCSKHLAKVHHQYVHIVEYELGDCPDHSRQFSRSSSDPS